VEVLPKDVHADLPAPNWIEVSPGLYEAIREPFCRGTKLLMDKDEDSNIHKARDRNASAGGTACPEVDGRDSAIKGP
jgi:hypothetical protein